MPRQGRLLLYRNQRVVTPKQDEEDYNMIRIHRKILSCWCSRNIDLLITITGFLILATAGWLLYGLPRGTAVDAIGFWSLVAGVVALSVGTAALICYRIILKWQRFFG